MCIGVPVKNFTMYVQGHAVQWSCQRLDVDNFHFHDMGIVRVKTGVLQDF